MNFFHNVPIKTRLFFPVLLILPQNYYDVISYDLKYNINFVTVSFIIYFSFFSRKLLSPSAQSCRKLTAHPLCRMSIRFHIFRQPGSCSRLTTRSFRTKISKPVQPAPPLPNKSFSVSRGLLYVTGVSLVHMYRLLFQL